MILLPSDFTEGSNQEAAFFLYDGRRIFARELARICDTETYQKGPETPYCQATFEDWRRVAAQVH